MFDTIPLEEGVITSELMDGLGFTVNGLGELTGLESVERVFPLSHERKDALIETLIAAGLDRPLSERDMEEGVLRVEFNDITLLVMWELVAPHAPAIRYDYLLPTEDAEVIRFFQNTLGLTVPFLVPNSIDDLEVKDGGLLINGVQVDLKSPSEEGHCVGLRKPNKEYPSGILLYDIDGVTVLFHVDEIVGVPA